MLNKKVTKNAAWIIGCRLTQSVFALIINLLTARYLGPSNFGIINYAASLVAFVTPIMNLGVNNILVNELIKEPDKEGEILGTSIVLTLITSFCCIVGIFCFVFFANAKEIETLIVCVLYSLLLIAQSLELLQYWFQAHLLSKYTSLSVLFAYLIVSAYKIYLLITHKSIYWFAISNAFDYFLIAIALYLIYKKIGGQALSVSLNRAKNLFAQGKHYIIAGLMGVALAQTDKIMLKFMYNNEAVGLYSAAFAIAGLSSFVFSAIIDSMRPLILQYKTSDNVEYENQLSLLYGIVVMLSLVQAIFIGFFAKTIIVILYGESFLPAKITLQIIVWYSIFSYIGAVRSVWILAEDKQQYLWIISLLGLVINIILNFIMIPLWGIEGAAFATLLTQFFANFVANYIIKPLKRCNSLLFRGLNIKKLLKK